ncbi:chromate transporter [Limnohabitans sp.]|jgi:chromate transporter|uniref:chromate transporter n=1 Tax=Limnohabitans sp. TaxID=1907725 RepID=UPI00311E3D2F
MNPVLNLSAADWLQLFEHFASLSLLAVGGAITTAPDMHRYLVSQLGWLSDSQFTSSIALAQAAPGPNILFVALMGWNVGLNASQGAAWWMQGALALTGVCVAMLGIMLPSSILTYMATRWAHQHRDMLAIRAFKSGMAPIVIALLMATGWLLTVSHDQPARDWPLYLLTLLTTLVVWRSRIHMLWLIGLGALLGGLGWV